MGRSEPKIEVHSSNGRLLVTSVAERVNDFDTARFGI